MNVLTVTNYTAETQATITGLVPDVKYRVFVRAENELHDIDNTTSRSENISVKLLEGGTLLEYGVVQFFKNSMLLYRNKNV